MTKIQKTFVVGFILVNMIAASYFTLNAFVQ